MVSTVRIEGNILVNRIVAFNAKNTEILLKTVMAINRVLYQRMASEPLSACAMAPVPVEKPIKRKNMRHELLKKLSLSLFLIRANRVKLITAKTISVKLVTGSPMVRPATVMISISKVWSCCFGHPTPVCRHCNVIKSWAKLRYLFVQFCDFAT